MRKFTFLIFALCVWVSAMAQKPFIVSDAPVDGQWAANTHWYLIRNAHTDTYHANKGYISTAEGYCDEQGRILLENGTKPSDDKSQWCVVGNDNDGYKFYNKGEGTSKVLGFGSDTWVKMYDVSTSEEGVSTAFDFAQSTTNWGMACFKIHGTNTKWWNNMNINGTVSCRLGIWDNSAAGPADGGSSFEFRAVEMPFTASELTEGSFGDNMHWYKLIIQRTPVKYTGYDVWGANNVANSVTAPTNYNAGNVFAFVETNDGYRIYNYGAGSQKVLASNQVENNQILSFEDESSITESSWNIIQNSENGWAFKKNNTQNGILNDVNGRLGYWTGSIAAFTDAGSTFRFEEVSNEELATIRSNSVNTLQEKYEAFASYPVGESVGTYKVGYADAAKEKVDNTLTDFEANNNYWLAVEEVKSPNTKESRNEPSADKYYYIKCTTNSDRNYLVEDYNLLLNNESSYALGWKAPAAWAPALWKFTDNNNANYPYHLQNANSGLYLTKVSWGVRAYMVNEDDANIGEYTIWDRTNAQHDDAVTLVSKNGASDKGTINASSGTPSYNSNGDANNWYIVEANELPVTISAVGYATLNLPVEVSLPAEVKAYVGATENETTVALKEITGNIPANTPVILVAEGLTSAKTFNFPIVYGQASEAIAPNAFSGTTVPATIDANATAYILKNGDNGIGMYKVTSETDRTIPANKAYLGSLAASEAPAMLAFSFGGTATGIEGVESVNVEDNTYYDLNGRRVLYPSKGVYVKANGQKVMFK